MTLDSFQKSFKNVKFLTLVMHDSIIDMSTNYVNEKEMGPTTSHWVRTDERKNNYLPARFLAQKLQPSIYHSKEEEKIKIPIIHVSNFAEGQRTFFELARDGLKWITNQKPYKIPSATNVIIKEFYKNKNYTALVDFTKLKDTFDMQIPNPMVTSWHSTFKDQVEIKQKDIDENKPLVTQFHTILLKHLYIYYMLGICRIFQYLFLFFKDEDVQVNPAFKTLWHYCMDCVEGGENLILNSVIPGAKFFCDQEKCKYISKFKKDGEWIEIYKREDEIKDFMLPLPNLQYTTVSTENGFLKVSWEFEEGEFAKLLDGLLVALNESNPSKFTLDSKFPRKKTNVLTAESISEKTSEIEGQIKEILTTDFPIRSILSVSESESKEELRRMLSGILPNNIQETTTERILHKIKSGMWSTALEYFIRLHFRHDNKDKYTQIVRAFLELSGLALGFINYRDKNNEVMDKPKVSLSDSIDTLSVTDDSQKFTLVDFFNIAKPGAESKNIIESGKYGWLYTNLENGRFEEKEDVTNIQTFILSFSVLLRDRITKSKVPILKKLNKSICFRK